MMGINRSYAFEAFKPWSGAIDTWNTLEEYDKVSTLECVLEDLYPDGIEETTLNDLLWFEEESLYEWVGLHYGVNSGIVSDEPLCPACDDHIPEYECDNCLDTVCEHCMVKCVKCNKVICKDCNNGEKEKPLCSDCYDDKEN